MRRLSRAARQGLRRVSRPLWILMAVALVHGLAWSVAVAPLNGPDEGAHAAYAQLVAETGHAPNRDTGNGSYSSALNQLQVELNLSPIIGHTEGRPFWSRADDVSKRIDGLPMDNGTGPNPAGNYPPLYYMYTAAAYRLSPDTSLLGRLWFMRFAGVLLFVATVAFTWLVAGELFTAPWKRALAAAVVALQPKLGSMAGVINPDIMLTAIGTATLWMALRVGLRGPTIRRAAALGLLSGAAAFCHPRGLYVAPCAVLALLVGCIRARPALRPAMVALAVLAVPAASGLLGAIAFTRAHAAGAAFGTGSPVTGINPREFLSYVWQFYLPKLSTMYPKVGPAYGYRQVFVESYWGSFASLESNYKLWVYDTLQVATVFLAVWVWTVAAYRPRRLLARWPAVVLLVAFCSSLVLLLHIVSYSSLRTSVGNAGDPVITGRYLLPVVSVLGCAIAFAVGGLPRRARAPVAGAIIGALAVLAIAGVGLTAVRFDG